MLSRKHRQSHVRVCRLVVPRLASKTQSSFANHIMLALISSNRTLLIAEIFQIQTF